jgi:hypothetical protein
MTYYWKYIGSESVVISIKAETKEIAETILGKIVDKNKWKFMMTTELKK